jgi:predicted ferric reductase
LFSNFVPCSLNEVGHKVMFIVWTVLFTVAVLEAIVATIRKTNRILSTFQFVSILMWLVVMLIYCVYVLGRNFQVPQHSLKIKENQRICNDDLDLKTKKKKKKNDQKSP